MATANAWPSAHGAVDEETRQFLTTAATEVHRGPRRPSDPFLTTGIDDDQNRPVQRVGHGHHGDTGGHVQHGGSGEQHGRAAEYDVMAHPGQAAGDRRTGGAGQRNAQHRKGNQADRHTPGLAQQRKYSSIASIPPTAANASTAIRTAAAGRSPEHRHAAWRGSRRRRLCWCAAVVADEWASNDDTRQHPTLTQPARWKPPSA